MTNNLSEVQDHSQSSIAQYYSDPFSRRLRKMLASETTHYYYSNEGLVGEFDANGSSIRSYTYLPVQDFWQSSPVSLFEPNQGYAYFHLDFLGTPHKATSSNGVLKWSAQYQAFGKASINSAQMVNNLRFAGQYFDQETGNHYNYFRDYDPSLGRYIQSDPIGLNGGLNIYAYVGSNPLMYIDPHGLTKACYRPLRKQPFGVIGTDQDKALNSAYGHEHIFFDDGTDIGFGGDGIYQGEDVTEFSECEDIDAEKEDVEKVIDRIRDRYNPEDYRFHPRIWGGNNCQDFVDEIRNNLR